ncbi:MAG: hypothetical protein AAGD14_16140 [Planctomycetota bacterium]
MRTVIMLLAIGAVATGEPLKPARKLQFDSDATITAVTPEGEEAPSICILGPVKRLGTARGGVQLPKHWLWLAEMQRGYDASVLAAQPPGIVMHFAPSLTAAQLDAMAKSPGLRYLAFGRSPVTTLDALVPAKDLEGLQVSQNGALTDIDALEQLPNLRALGLDGCMGLSRDALAVLPRLLRLERVYLAQSRADDALLANLPKSVTHLRLRGTAVRDKGLAVLAKRCKSLEEIDLESCGVTDAGIKSLARAKNLRRLHLGMTQVTEGALKSIAKCKELRALDLSSVRLGTKALKRWKGNAKLEVLVLVDCGVNADGMQAIARRDGLKELTIHKIDDATLDVIGGLAAMERLHIRFSPELSDEAVVRALENMPKLRALSLSGGTGLTDACSGVFRKLKALEWLDLSRCANLTDATLKNLHGLPTLRQLVLSNCPKITPAGVQALRAATPSLQQVNQMQMRTGNTPADVRPR